MSYDKVLTLRELLDDTNWDQSKYPYPNRTLPDWKYENMRDWEKYMWAFPTEDWATLPEGVHVIIRDSAIGIADKLPEGVRVRIDDAVKPNFEGRDAVFWLANEYARHGLTIHLSAMASEEDPLIILIEQNLDNAFINQFKHNLMVESGSKGLLIEIHKGEENIHFNQHIWNVQLKRNSKLTHYRIDQISDFTFNQIYTDARLDESSNYNLRTWSSGGAMARHQMNAFLLGRDADLNVQTAAIACGHQSVSHQNMVHHCAPSTKSSQTIYGMALQQAQVFSKSKVLVQKGADGVQSEQKNRNILEGSQARIYSRPELEIYAQNVKCAHGSTIGKLDEKALFYLKSRGLSHRAAEQILREAFFNHIISDWDKFAASFIQDHLFNTENSCD